ncbi:MAG: LPS export ABC transporter permease LptG [Desulfobacterales bacterium CG23_combo_of_CG06-09_8_20_14_all_52_9]|nr:MAG: LPS export ABC transporter permease LptG [Desulfobacterales bacterium CG23_combo_of_CG06-09_8_20_14_all_52_9]
MSILHRYILKEIARYFLMVLAMVVGIYLAVDFFEKIDDFIEAGLPLSRAGVYFLLKIPFILAQIIPVGVLLSTLITFGLMNKNNEWIALKGSGIGVSALLFPVLLAGLGFSVLLFLISEIGIPLSMTRANQIWLVEVRKESAMTSREKNIWIKSNRYITHIRYYNPAQKTFHGITLHGFGPNFQLVHRIDAEQGYYQNGKWILLNGMEQVFDSKTNRYQTIGFDHKEETLDLLPEDLQRVVKKSEEMNLVELHEYVRKVETEGYDATLYRVDLHAKIAFPLVCVIMSLLGLGIALKRSVKEALPMGIACGIGAAFIYWIFHSFCLSLGYGEMLPVAIAPWVANFVFACFAAVNLMHAD